MGDYKHTWVPKSEEFMNFLKAIANLNRFRLFNTKFALIVWVLLLIVMRWSAILQLLKLGSLDLVTGLIVIAFNNVFILMLIGYFISRFVRKNNHRRLCADVKKAFNELRIEDKVWLQDNKPNFIAAGKNPYPIWQPF